MRSLARSHTRTALRDIFAQPLAEQQLIRREEIDAAVLKTVATTLMSFGIEQEDRQELRADLQYLRRWRRSVEQAQTYTLKAVITVIATALLAAVWLGLDSALGK
ncbi:hypothetical protein J6497_06550 [Bradyrhizobium sp. CNPSo 4026]|nr:hypothetical protein [Bradyrhizobium cenepequi]